tara:strand:+ start:124 stop:1560 length:1437 start_codon:yes stop_codon:yes gene_type:complete
MAKQGLLAQSRPAANTDTVLYRAPIDQSASTVLTIANDGTGSAYDVAVKDYDQKLTLDASTYKLHEGDLISSYFVEVGTSISSGATGFTANALITTTDQEKSFKFESFYIPAFTEIFVKSAAIRAVTVESDSGAFNAGETLTKGSGSDTTTALIYGSSGQIVYIGASTINGSGSEFTDGDSVTSSGNGAATISTGGVAAADNEFVFSTTTSSGVYSFAGPDLFNDRTYRFNLADSSMSGRDFKLSTTVNGEWGPDGTAGNSDDGTEYTTGKTTNGTAGQSGAYSQYDFSGAITTNYYVYDGGTGTASNAGFGGSNRFLFVSPQVSYDGFYVFDVTGTLSNNVDTFTVNSVTYTITSHTTGAYGYVRDYTGTSLKFIKGLNSGDWSGSDTFRDVPKLNTASRTTATISSVAVASAAVEASNYIVDGVTNGANEVDKITSLVVGPGETVVVKSTTQNNVFSLIGFADTSTAFTTRVFGQS